MTSGPVASASARPKVGWYESQGVKALASLQHGQIRLLTGDRCLLLGTRAADGLSAEVRIHDPQFWQDLCLEGDIGAARAYVEGLWTTSDLTALIRIFCRNLSLLSASATPLRRIALSLMKSLQRWIAPETRARSRRNIAAHYDLGNDFFRLFLDPTLMYSSALYPTAATTLEEASLHKLDRVCCLADLKPDDDVLEIGTGWGGLALHAAEQFGCRVTTTTISREQHDLARERFAGSPYRDQIRLLSSDYRDLTGQYDKVISIEMIEAVGHERLPAYFQACSRLLKPGGRLLIQGILMPDYRYAQYCRSIDFIQKFIFPGGHLPSVGAMQQATAGTSLQLVAAHTFPDSYARTLQDWRLRLNARRDEARELGYDDRFLRLWEYYFCYCEAAFRERAVSVGHFVWEKPLYPGS